ncbi:hypothetical protein ACTHGU_01925 [Chitinophagaceae bacterium MMS25-I14]
MKHYSRHRNVASSLKMCLYTTAILLLSGCMTTNIVSQYDSNTIANNPVNRKTTWTYAWGLVQPKDINPHCDSSFNHLNKVSMKTNFGFILLSVATLGIVVPMRVEWYCAPPDPATEILGTNN